jgi:hypothetical protein
MTYSELTLHQRITLKGWFKTEPKLHPYNVAIVIFGFRAAIDYFLTDDINVLYKNLNTIKYN